MVLRKFVKSVLLIGLVAGLGACAQTQGNGDLAKADPFEETNRFFHQNNLRLDRNVLRPAAQGYGYVTPTLFKHMIGNGLSHLELTRDFANYLLQGDVDRSLETLGRFTLNTIVGAGGLLDPATEFGLPREPTDFGMTLGRYGVGEGGYLVLPLLGATTVRDAAGYAVDRAFSPTSYLGPFIAADGISPAVTVLGLVHRRDKRADLIDDVLYNSPDSYVTIRSAYLQRRRAQIAGEDGAEELLPDIFDDEAAKE